MQWLYTWYQGCTLRIMCIMCIMCILCIMCIMRIVCIMCIVCGMCIMCIMCIIYIMCIMRIVCGMCIICVLCGPLIALHECWVTRPKKYWSHHNPVWRETLILTLANLILNPHCQPWP